MDLSENRVHTPTSFTLRFSNLAIPMETSICGGFSIVMFDDQREKHFFPIETCQFL